DDATGARFADALIDKARGGVHVRLLYDWLGCLGTASRSFWSRLREGGVDVRCYNPPRLESPLAWLSLDHRRMVAVDGEVGFITGRCVGRRWEGMPEKHIEPWRDTGLEIRGPAVADIEAAFAHIWALAGSALAPEEFVGQVTPAGDTALRIVASGPATA